MLLYSRIPIITDTDLMLMPINWLWVILLHLLDVIKGMNVTL